MIARRAIAYQYAEYCLPDKGRIGWQIQTRRKSVPDRLALGHKRCIAGNARGRSPRQRRRFCAPVFRRVHFLIRAGLLHHKNRHARGVDGVEFGGGELGEGFDGEVHLVSFLVGFSGCLWGG